MAIVVRSRGILTGVVAAPVISHLVGFGVEAITLDVTTEQFDRALGVKREPVLLYVVRVTVTHGLPPATVLIPEMDCEPGDRVIFDCIGRVEVEGEPNKGAAFYAPFGGRVVERAATKSRR